MVYYSVSRYNEDMFLVGMLSWWYGDGWRQRVHMIRSRLAVSSDYFSLGLLIMTLFAPYRQISAGGVSGSFAVQVRAFFDRSISRLVGAFIRTFVLLFGCIVILFQALFGGIVLLLWMIIPAFPVIGLLLYVLGWVPAW